MKKRRRERKRKRIRMTVLSVVVAVVILLLTAAVKGNDGGQQVETHEEVKSVEAMSSRTQTADTLTGAAVPEQEKEFEEWVKPHIEGMVPVYGRAGIDYISLDDFELMGKTVFAEAKTEEFEGQVAVAEVILNRVESENFPDTVEEVIKQDGAFSTWGNGSAEAASLDDECLEAVQDAVNERIFPDSVVYSMAAAAVLVIAALMLAVHTHSYARSNESRNILVGKYDGENAVVSYDTEELSRMISYDDKYVYVEREAFEKFLIENNADGEIWIVFGGFYKLPGLAGAAESCIYESGSGDRVVQIPYESIMDNWYMELLKLL